MAEHVGLGRRLRRARRRFLFLAARSVLRWAGFRRAMALGGLFGELQFRLAPAGRRRLQRDMAHALGRPADDPALAAQLREAYRVNGGAVFEILAMFDRRLPEGELAARCEVEGLEHLRTALAGGRGAVLLASHMGNAALLTIRLVQDGWPVSVVYRQSRMGSAGFFYTGLANYGIQPILANAGIRAYGQMLAALKQGRVVFMMLDQGVRNSEDGVTVRFLGKDVPMPAGAAQLARTARAPLLPVATTAARPLWRFRVEAPVPLGAASVEDDLATLVATTERHVREQPQLWSWPHRRWRRAPLPPPGP